MKLSTILLACFFILASLPQAISQAPNYFNSIQTDKSSSLNYIQGEYALAQNDLMADLSAAESYKKPKARAVELSFPVGPNTFETFKVFKSTVMHPDLEAKFPKIRTYIGYGVEDPTKRLRFSTSHKNIHATIKAPGEDTWYLNPEDGNYVLYKRGEYKAQTRKHKEVFSCGVDASEDIQIDLPKEITQTNDTRSGSDCRLRTYRLAIATTGEYTQYHGGTVEDALAEVVTSMVRVNGIYEDDFGVTMQLVANNDLVIYTDGASDPFSNGSPGPMLGENQTALDNVIGSENYDVGHVYGVGGGGLATLRCPCGNSKARAMTGLGNPINDPFYVDYVSHEIGHQFGGNHTQNNDCNRSGNTAWEPGSASTIMGYAGICSPNVQNNSDDHFHGGSIGEVLSFIQSGGGSTCGTNEDISNDAPIISLTSNFYTLPISTPFVLTAEAEDPNEEDILTYCWEQMDQAVATMPPSPTSTVGPAFRSNSPSTSGSRYFPNLNDLTNNISPTWEVLPFFSRDMSFRVTVRDNHLLGGCQQNTEVLLSFDESAGPFLVETPNTNVTWMAGETRTIEWNVANTDQFPVSSPNVDIFLSSDGGFTYPLTIAENVPNNGSLEITVPAIFSDSCRVMVKGNNHVFFDISDENFSITSPFALTVENDDQTICVGNVATYNINFEAGDSFEGVVDFSLETVPLGGFYEFTPSSLSTSGTVQLELINIAPNNYSFDIIAMNDQLSVNELIQLNVVPAILDNIEQQNPPDYAEQISSNPTLEWSEINHATEYIIELDVNPAFNTPNYQSFVSETNTLQLDALEKANVYYWKVSANNDCAMSISPKVFSFQTANTSCDMYASEDIPIALSTNEEGSYFSELVVNESFNITEIAVSLEIEHSWVGDIDAFLVNESVGERIELFNRIGYDGAGFGCDRANLSLSFSDFAENTADNLEATCENGDYAAEGEYQSIQPLNKLLGENANLGPWVLEINDYYAGDGGALLAWSMLLCGETPITQEIGIEQNLLFVNLGEKRTIEASFLNTNDANPTSAVYTLTTVPFAGSLSLENGGMSTSLSIGDQFTQADIDAQKLSYTQDGTLQFMDSFKFNLLGSGGAWISNQTFNIQIITEGLFVSAEANTLIDCPGDDTGSLTITATGGLEPYEFSINNEPFQESNVYENLTAGSYTPRVRDQGGNVMTGSVVVLNDPDPIVINLSTSFFSIIVDANGGTGMLSYSLDGIDYQTSNTFENLTNGDYTIYVKDENDCNSSEMISISVPLLDATVIPDHPLCAGETNGSLEVFASGGLPSYEYSLDGSNYQSSAIFEGLGAGSYMIFIRDAASQIFIVENTEIIEPEPLTAIITNEGYSLIIDADGGTGEYSYSLDGGVEFLSNPIFDNLEIDNYSIVVIDDNDCLFETEASVDVQTLGISINAMSIQLSCYNDTNASIIVDATGGLEPITYSLDNINFQTSNIFENLAAGSYTVYAKDAVQTAIIETYDIINPTEITFTTSVFNNEITVMAEGGTNVFTYSIDGINFQESNVLLAGDNGNYEVYVQDSNGCLVSGAVAISSILNVEYNQQDILCHGNFEDVFIEVVEVIGGFPAYEYSTDGINYQMSNLLAITSPGNYSLYVRDTNNQSFQVDDIIFTEPELLSLDYSVDNTSITLEASGGTGSYSYSLNGADFQDSPLFENVDFDTYDAIVVDENGCEALITIVLSSLNKQGFDLTMNISPNPGNGIFNLRLEAGSRINYQIEIFDVSSQLILKNDLRGATSVNHQIDISEASAGLYYLVITNEKGKRNVYSLVKE